jgi:hypothetical protein
VVKALLKDGVVDSGNKKLVAFAQSIVFDDLFKECAAFLGVECSFTQPEIMMVMGELTVNFKSSDITDKAGIFSVLLAHCYLRSSAFDFCIDRATGEVSCIVTVDICYMQKDFCRNRMRVLQGRYTAAGGWQICNADQTYEFVHI